MVAERLERIWQQWKRSGKYLGVATSFAVPITTCSKERIKDVTKTKNKSWSASNWKVGTGSASASKVKQYPDPHQFADDKPQCRYWIWAYLSTCSRFWAFIWKLGSVSGSGCASKWKVGSGSGYAWRWWGSASLKNHSGSGSDVSKDILPDLPVT